MGIELKSGHFLQPIQPNKIQIAINIGSRKKSWKKGRLCKLVSLWILISVKDLIEKKTSKTVKHLEFIEYEKDRIDGKREKMIEVYNSLFNSKKIDCLLVGSTQYLKNIEDKWNQADKLKPSDTVWTKDVVYRPFLSYDKSWIKKGCDINGLTDDLVKSTVSCVSARSYPCKDCLWCAEKYAIFGSY